MMSVGIFSDPNELKYPTEYVICLDCSPYSTQTKFVQTTGQANLTVQSLNNVQIPEK